MKVSLQTIGGFSGPAGAVTRTVDVDALSEDRRREFVSLIDAARVFERPPKMLLGAPRPWDFRHILTVHDGARSHSVELHLDAVDAPLRELVCWIEDKVEPS